jgi:hypothetical protein
MQYTVDLKVHEDERHGIWGLCPKAALDRFEPFWGADGVFHDVFEHYFEDEHSYFKGDAAFTLWGEMAASGAGIAYRKLGINNFRYRNYGRDRDFCVDTKQNLEEAIYECKQERTDTPYMEYSIDKALCKVPYQRPVDYTYNYDLYSWLGEYEYWVREQRQKDRFTKSFMKGVSYPHIQRCYLWGYNFASRLIDQDRDHSYKVLDQFLTDWHQICEGGEVTDLMIDDEFAYPLHSIKFQISSHPKLSIKTTLIDEAFNDYPFEKLFYL